MGALYPFKREAFNRRTHLGVRKKTLAPCFLWLEPDRFHLLGAVRIQLQGEVPGSWRRPSDLLGRRLFEGGPFSELKVANA